MSLWLRLCLGLAILAPSLAHAANLDIPSNGDKLSGIGLISGWKCEANGEITIVFNDGDPETASIPTKYGAPRGDTSSSCGDDDGNNGFYALWNWAILGDGKHTVVAYDNGVEFARSTFSVTTAGVPYLSDAPDTCVTVEDFPSTGETTYLEWNTSTQHFEMVESCEPTPSEPGDLDLGECMVDMTLQPGQMCSGSILTVDFTFSVYPNGEACVVSALVNECYDTALNLYGASARKNTDGSWTITGLP